MLTTGFALRASITTQDYKKIADHRGHATSSRLHPCLRLNSCSAISTMPTAPSHNFLSRRDDGRRLLTPQHRARDFRRVRQMADARLDHVACRPSRADCESPDAAGQSSPTECRRETLVSS